MRTIIPFICLALLGIAVLPLLTVKLAPSRDLPSLTVAFSMSDNSARVVEMEATSKLEGMLSRVRGLRKIRSESSNGSGNITLELDRYTNVEMARFEVSTLIRQAWASLPESVSYPYIYTRRSDEKADAPFMTYLLNAPATPYYICKYAEERIQPELAQLEGVNKVTVSGATPMEWQLEYDLDLLSAAGVTVGNISTAIQQYLSKMALGTVRWQSPVGDERMIRLTLSGEEMKDTFDPGKITVRNSRNESIGLERLVKVKRCEQEPPRYYRVNGMNSIYLSITADENANQLKLSKQIKKKMEELSLSSPAGYRMTLSSDTTEYINESLDTIYFRSGLTMLLLLFFVLLVTRSFRYLYLISINILINLAISFLFYYLLGLEIQLYSLAGITLSLSLIMDNTIVMVNHLMFHKDRKVFLALLAATLTTIAALSVVFFLDESIRLNLEDFSKVIIINLTVSLFTTLFLVPSLMEKIAMKEREKQVRRVIVMRWMARITNVYERTLYFLLRWRTATVLVLLFSFGLPFFQLPKMMRSQSEFALMYNKVMNGRNTFTEKVLPEIFKWTGGTLRLFVQKVNEGNYGKAELGEKVVYITATLPNGSTLKQMNDLAVQMESYLSTFKGIKRFETSVSGPRRTSFRVYFTKENQNSGFPYQFKQDAFYKGIELGSGSWTVSGLDDSRSLSNEVTEWSGQSKLLMAGYNYDQLFDYALQVKDTLLTYRRISEVLINSEFQSIKDDYSEFFTDIDSRRLIENQFSPQQLFSSFTPMFVHGQRVESLSTSDGSEAIKLYATQSREYDVWNMMHLPIGNSSNHTKMMEVATIEKGKMAQNVVKEDQQYLLCLQYAYTGSGNQQSKVVKRIEEDFTNMLPMGYTIKEPDREDWQPTEKNQYLLILLVVTIIWFITSILFNSTKQSLAVIFVIPVAFVGVFLTFYQFGLNFDQGGFSSFVLLSGITVNACIYIIDEYNNIMKRRPNYDPMRAYLKSWNAKITPVFLTTISTMLGFIPFMIGEHKEAFWFPLAAGTIGGLVFSLIGVFLYLPLFTLNRKKIHKEKIKKLNTI